MSAYYILEPEVPGNLGRRTQMNTGVHPPKVTHLHFVFDDWAGDELVENFPCYLITISLADSFVSNEVSGFELANAELGKSEIFRELHPNRTLPDFRWMKVTGQLGKDDIFLTDDFRLGVTRKVLDLVLATNPEDLEIEEAG